MTTSSDERARFAELDRKIENLSDTVQKGFERLVNAFAVKVDRDELEKYVRRDVYEEHGRRIDLQIGNLQKRDEQEDSHDIQQSLLRQGQRFWWVPLVGLALRPDLLHGLANLLGGGPK